MGRGGKIVHKRAAGRKRKKNVEDDDDDENYVAEEEESSFESDTSNEESFNGTEAASSPSSSEAEDEMRDTKRNCRSGHYSSRQRSRISDFEELDDDYCEDDEDFSPDADDNEDWEEESRGCANIRGPVRTRAAKRGGGKLKRKISKPRVKRKSSKVTAVPAKRKRRRVAASSDDDDNFIVKDPPPAKSRRKVSKKVNKRMANSRPSKKKKSPVDSDSFESDFLTSDDDLSSEDRVSMDNSKNKKRTMSVRKNKVLKADSETSDSDFVVSDEELSHNGQSGLTKPRKINRAKRKNARTSKKQPSMESECTDSDDEVSENKAKDFEIERTLNLPKYEGPVGKKGKQKETDDLVNQPCGICLSEEHKGTIQGILNCCSHYFCFSCIMEWSKVESRCPVCKRRFVTITKSSRSDPMLQMRRPVIRVQMRDQVYQPSEEELRVLLDPYENVVCIECHQGGDDDLMLLCDICDSSAHTYCVGLGNEVPDGNWYCECCKLADEGSLHSQAHDSQGASSSHMPHGGIEQNGSINSQINSFFHRSVSSQGQSSLQGFDLNSLPRNFIEDNGAMPASPGIGASTLSGRRAIQRHIRLLLSNNRVRPLYADAAPHTEPARTGLEQNGMQIHASERPNSFHRTLVTDQQQENRKNFLHSDLNLVPCTFNEGGSFRHVEGAKKQVQSMVKGCLRRLSREAPLERSIFKKTARKATHTILAACGIEHNRSMVSSLVQPPDRCSHDLDRGPVNLVRGCCSSCFSVYVNRIVQMFVETL